MLAWVPSPSYFMTKQQLIFKELASSALQFTNYVREKSGINPDEPRYVRFRRAISNAHKSLKDNRASVTDKLEVGKNQKVD